LEEAGVGMMKCRMFCWLASHSYAMDRAAPSGIRRTRVLPHAPRAATLTAGGERPGLLTA
jgi:hypothetical protein